MAQILYKLGLISRNHVEETSGLNLTGDHVGQTKTKVQDVLEGKNVNQSFQILILTWLLKSLINLLLITASRGGILFIDEAYELVKCHYSEEAQTALVS